MKKNNYFMIGILVIAIIVLACIFISSTNAFAEKTYINVTEDGYIKFETTGFEVNEMDIIEEIYTGQFDNKTFYCLTDSFGREVEIYVHHTSIDNKSSMESNYQNSTYLKGTAKWVGNYSGQYFSVVINDCSDDSYFNKDFIHQRIIIDQ